METLQQSHTSPLPWPAMAPARGARPRATTISAATVATLRRLIARQPGAGSIIGIAASTAYLPAGAGPVLDEAVREDSNLEVDWLWYATKVPSSSERRYCLQRALAINPQNDVVRYALTSLPPRPAA